MNLVTWLDRASRSDPARVAIYSGERPWATYGELARKAASEMEATVPDTYVTDCSLSALQIEDVRGAKPKHPATVLREAYGLPDNR